FATRREMADGGGQVLQVSPAPIFVIGILKGLTIARGPAVIRNNHDEPGFRQNVKERVECHHLLAVWSTMNADNGGRWGPERMNLLTIEAIVNGHLAARKLGRSDAAHQAESDLIQRECGIGEAEDLKGRDTCSASGYPNICRLRGAFAQHCQASPCHVQANV